jgi:hypothetical protein
MIRKQEFQSFFVSSSSLASLRNTIQRLARALSSDFKELYGLLFRNDVHCVQAMLMPEIGSHPNRLLPSKTLAGGGGGGSSCRDNVT